VLSQTACQTKRHKDCYARPRGGLQRGGYPGARGTRGAVARFIHRAATIILRSFTPQTPLPSTQVQDGGDAYTYRNVINI
jgi:hypothetical protein